MDFQGVVEDFLFHCAIERRMAENTVQAYRCDLRHFSRFAGNCELTDALNVETLKRYLAHMLESAKLSTSTARRRLACLQAFSCFASEQTGLPNPFKDWSPALKRAKRLPRALSCDEVLTLVDERSIVSRLDADTVFCVLLISATGVRVSELCSTRAGDVSADGTAIHILGKGSRDRIVFVSDEGLRSDLVRRRNERISRDGINAQLLLNSRGRPLQPQTLRRRLHKLSGQTDANRVITPHMLRHTAATLLIERGVDIRFVQRLLGHASIATTEIYTQVNDRSLRRAIFEADTVGMLAGGG